METMNGFGVMVGPFFGGLLYEIGGFHFPFAICGSLLILSAMLSTIFLNKSDVNNVDLSSDLSNDISDEKNMVVIKTTSYRQLLMMPSIFICCWLLIISQTSVTW